MATRCNIIVKLDGKTTILYKHHDGYNVYNELCECIDAFKEHPENAVAIIKDKMPAVEDAESMQMDIKYIVVVDLEQNILSEYEIAEYFKVDWYLDMFNRGKVNPKNFKQF